MINEIKEAMKTGKIFSCSFRKKDDSIRHMVARMGVRKHLKTDKPATTAHIPKYITVFEISKNQYRTINIETLISFKCGDINESF